MQAQIVTVALAGRSDNHEVTPECIRLGDLARFAREVQTFLQGDGKHIDADTLPVAIKQGSFALETVPLTDEKLFADLSMLEQATVMTSAIDGARRTIIEKWQKQAKGRSEIFFKIVADFLAKPIIISASTDYRRDDADHWVQVERYVRGTIEDLGGSKNPNAHVRLPDGKQLTVSADRDVLREDTLNRLYKPAMLRIRAEYNIQTRALRNARLLDFVEHSQSLDESRFERLKARSSVAWKEVASAAQWVDEMRGGAH